ncbi:predicted protein [Histoplasma capsulatum G186AR]|uniref:Uncharacterized protein n=1 Tax=Ajellomyces capsulatus (strain G186AR / H82 / ATCC MYA-2454 / RMSCC 2432) TaxID=447093 RepID=C0NYY9_AJECG|nr:uncharacterized protein HCBG_08369 [Histoplasma capsulatum G186AR]EEH03429.1 predicted protein [Histoplasma capsulatum G186AR]
MPKHRNNRNVSHSFHIEYNIILAPTDGPKHMRFWGSEPNSVAKGPVMALHQVSTFSWSPKQVLNNPHGSTPFLDRGSCLLLTSGFGLVRQVAPSTDTVSESVVIDGLGENVKCMEEILRQTDKRQTHNLGRKPDYVEVLTA